MVGMNDPSQSGPTYPFVAGMMQYLGGVAKGESYFSKLKANGLVINPTNGPTIQALTAGRSSSRSSRARPRSARSSTTRSSPSST